MTGIDPDEHARKLAAESLADDDPTAWFERLYSQARDGVAVVPWDVAARKRHAGSTVHYRQADLLDPPAEWTHAFDFVVESLTVQALPDPPRRQAIAQVPRLVAPGGTLLVAAAGRDTDALSEPGPPWPLVRAEIEAFASDGVEPVLIEELRNPGPPPSLRWRAEFRRPV